MDPELHQSRPGEDESNKQRLKIVRRKSGEVVHSALHVSTRWTSTVPPISTCVKSVHFGADLEQARSFFQLDSPNSISIESSVVHDEDRDCQYNLVYNDEHDLPRPTFKWKLLPQDTFPDTYVCGGLPIMLRNLSLTDDQKFIHGSVDVANLTAEKTVVCHFTCDEWKTVSEVSAHYCTDISSANALLGYDCFKFEIGICDILNLESTRSLSCCICYTVDGKRFWDNESANFQVHFCKHLSYTDMEGVIEKNSCSSAGKFTRGVRYSNTGPGMLGPLPLPAPGTKLGCYGSIDGDDTKHSRSKGRARQSIADRGVSTAEHQTMATSLAAASVRRELSNQKLIAGSSQPILVFPWHPTKNLWRDIALLARIKSIKWLYRYV